MLLTVVVRFNAKLLLSIFSSSCACNEANLEKILFSFVTSFVFVCFTSSNIPSIFSLSVLRKFFIRVICMFSSNVSTSRKNVLFAVIFESLTDFV